MRAWLVRLGARLVRHLPPRACYAVAAAVGTLVYFCWPRGRRAAVANFRRVLDDPDGRRARRVARRSFANYGRFLVDFLRLPGEPPARLIELAGSAEAFEVLERTLADGRGLVLVAFHFGSWDLGAAGAAARGVPVTVVAETFSDPGLDRFVVESRERLGMRVAKMEQAGPSLVRALRANGVLALLLDRPLEGGGVRVPFFGREVEIPAGPARLALRAGSPLVAVAFVRESPWDARIRIEFEPPFHAVSSGDPERDVQDITATLVRAHERFIRRSPEQWYMFREMWPEAGVRR